ncbi:MAG: hypothetical protein Q8P83_00390 [bacterium]|nr:hypothetical protein [bacterium]
MEEIEQNNKNRTVIIGVVVILIVVVVGFALVRRGSDNNSGFSGSDQIQDQQTNQSSGADKTTPTDTDAVGNANILKGILLASDDVKLGNLLLVRLDGDVYLSTSRDYSDFLNQEVLVRIDGTLEKFRLIDIELE